MVRARATDTVDVTESDTAHVVVVVDEEDLVDLADLADSVLAADLTTVPDITDLDLTDLDLTDEASTAHQAHLPSHSASSAAWAKVLTAVLIMDTDTVDRVATTTAHLHHPPASRSWMPSWVTSRTTPTPSRRVSSSSACRTRATHPMLLATPTTTTSPAPTRRTWRSHSSPLLTCSTSLVSG